MAPARPIPPAARALDDALARLQAHDTRELALHALAGIDQLAEGVLGPRARREERLLTRIEALERQQGAALEAQAALAQRLRAELERELAARVEELRRASAQHGELEARIRTLQSGRDELERAQSELCARLKSVAGSVGGLREKLLPAQLRAELERWRKGAP